MELASSIYPVIHPADITTGYYTEDIVLPQVLPIRVNNKSQKVKPENEQTSDYDGFCMKEITKMDKLFIPLFYTTCMSLLGIFFFLFCESETNCISCTTNIAWQLFVIPFALFCNNCCSLFFLLHCS